MAKNARAAEPLLVPGGVVIIPATMEQFYPAKTFVERERFGGGECSCATGDQVQTNFLRDCWFSTAGACIQEEYEKCFEEPKSQGKVSLRWFTLTQRSMDKAVIAELGGREKVICSLAAIHKLINQRRRKRGVLLRGHHRREDWRGRNVFYFLSALAGDHPDELLTMAVHWSGSEDYGFWCHAEFVDCCCHETPEGGWREDSSGYP